MLQTLWELARLFAKLGTISFGGPAAHIALMEQEVVERRAWLTHGRFLDLLGVTYLIPGPNATEMASQIGYHRAGLIGCVVAGVAFTLPAAVISGLLAWGYVQYQALPQIHPFLAGIKPVVLALMAAAVARLGRAALRRWQLVAIAAATAAAPLMGCDGILSLLVAGLLGTIFLACCGRGDRPTPGAAAGAAAIAAAGAAGASQNARASCFAAATLGAAGIAGAATVSLWKIGLFFLEVGALLYGGGYVLVAYLEGGLVNELGWLTQQQLLDAVAVGQVTPGPVLSTVTFVGYLIAGLPGAAVATVAVFLPSFVLVAAVNPWIARLRASPWASLFLDAVTAASLGLTVAVIVTLAPSALPDWRSWTIGALALVATWRWRVSSIWLVLAGALVGWLLRLG